MIKGLFLCFIVLFMQLGVLHYLDLRVASMPRLADAPDIDDLTTLPDTPAIKLDA